jgi:DNA repair exonuclease SbcCD ATPase subunit
MGVQGLLTRFGRWFRGRRDSAHGDYVPPQLSDEGLMGGDGSAGEADQKAIKAVAVRGKSESIEKLQAGFDSLIEQLSGINDHLRRQVAQHEELVARIDQLPRLVESFPASVENQKVLTEQLIEQLKANLLKDQQMLSAIEKIPTESAKQTDALGNIDRQLAAAADVDVQMTETFNKFNQALGKMNQSTQEHTDGIAQMSRTFAASDRYLKFIVSRQNRWFMWLFFTAIAVCVVVILIFVGIIIYLAR